MLNITRSMLEDYTGYKAQQRARELTSSPRRVRYIVRKMQKAMRHGKTTIEWIPPWYPRGIILPPRLTEAEIAALAQFGIIPHEYYSYEVCMDPAIIERWEDEVEQAEKELNNYISTM